MSHASSLCRNIHLTQNASEMFSMLSQSFFSLLDSGRKALSRIFKLCSPLKTSANATQLEYWLSETWVNLAMGKLYQWSLLVLILLYTNELVKGLKNRNHTMAL